MIDILSVLDILDKYDQEQEHDEKKEQEQIKAHARLEELYDVIDEQQKTLEK